MAKIIKYGKINCTDEKNLYLLNSLTLEGWIKLRDTAPKADFNYPNTALYIEKMLIFKCIELNMEMEEIMKLLDISKRAYKQDVIKYHSYNHGKSINYPNFVVCVKSVSDICTVIKIYRDSSKKYEKSSE